MARRASIPFVNASQDSNDRTGMSAAKMINFYMESFEGKMCAIGTPGLSTWYNASGNSVRGCINFQETGYAVVDNTVYMITNPTGTPVFTSLGTIDTSTGRVNFSAIAQAQIIILNDGINTYSITGATPPATLTNVSGVGGIPSSVLRVVAKDGFFIFLTSTNNQVWVSAVGAITVAGLSFFSINSNYDRIVTAICNDQFVYFFNQYTSEIWQDAGTDVQPFAQAPGGVLQVGTAAKDSPVVLSENCYFLAQSTSGILGIMMMNGTTLQLVSDSFLNAKIASYSTISDAFGWTHSDKGHVFYNITFPSADTSLAPTVGKTWSYDTSNGVWSELQSYNPTYFTQDRHAANCQMFIGNKTIIGDYQTGYFYVLSQDNFGDTLGGTFYDTRRVLIGPHIIDRDTFFSISNVELDLERGVGLDGSGQGSLPVLEFSVSKDRGHTYSTPTTLTVPPRGDYRTRIRKGSLGGGYCFTPKLEVSDPVRWRVYGMTVELGIANSNPQLNYG